MGLEDLDLLIGCLEDEVYSWDLGDYTLEVGLREAKSVVFFENYERVEFFF